MSGPKALPTPNLRARGHSPARDQREAAAARAASQRAPGTVPAAPKIPGYDSMNFEQKRFAQDKAAGRRLGR